MRRIALAVTAALVTLPAWAAKLNMEQIMASPDWIGPAVEQPHWSADGQSIYYSLKRDGSQVRDLYQVNPATGKTMAVSDAKRDTVSGPAVFDASHTHAAYIRHGDVFIKTLSSGQVMQVTRTPQNESSPQWGARGQNLQYRDGNQWYSYNLRDGLASPVAELKSADNPDQAKQDQLERLQMHLFSTLREIKHNEDAQKAQDSALDKADPTRSAQPYYLGKDSKIVDTSLSPDGRYMLVVTQSANYDAGKSPQVIHYVTRSGYVKPEDARTYVGHNDPAPQQLKLLDLKTHHQYSLSLDALPGIHTDPLAKLRAQTQAKLRKQGHDAEADALDAPKTRGVRIAEGSGYATIVWSDNGAQAAVQLRAIDNKDRWLTTVDFAKHALAVQNHLHDDAWISWNFNDFGFLKDNHTLWFLSEVSNFSQLYEKPLGGATRQLTSGHFEVSHPQLSPDGKWFYVRTNKETPYDYDIYRLPATGGSLTRVTHFQALDGFELSPDGRQIAVLHSTPYTPPQLAVINAAGGQAHELTDTLKPGYKKVMDEFVAPKYVKVPSSHGDFGIWAKLYLPKNFNPNVKHPAAVFVHGAGYLQDVTRGWSYYFREQMFNDMLTQEGYVVIDMDYRASEGYGRDWRTAIYQHMGHPELEDLLDGKAYMVKHYNVDPKHVGIYGGSYGGFMTEMALLRAPGQFAAGAALRPPSDWTSYNHEYTANILNDPQIDPQAYKVSSPIEYAKNLADPLLICHGLIDNNVMPSDSIRLYQRFIELHKKNFWISLYPMERHSFHHADDWYDEYRRIHELFERFVSFKPTAH
ncbi:prolyl oligopeptidase family serine peptidase [Oleiagrimonas sp. C23AA]|uniref:S9 family peptidase n=1 Tax=Oleiagrimonas sp. C23AA TaxID=2719047 RepID=UPI0014235A3D|nr:prolyl oligopeptidase family serine peptidase [Oleiagrimonas sp. C23AA]NII11325.1 S9 family peptidase [Oleiagrimonas sp. C23AA]